MANALNVTLDDFLCDSLEAAVVPYHKEIAALTKDCTPLEIRVLADMLRAHKETLRGRGLSDYPEGRP